MTATGTVRFLLGLCVVGAAAMAVGNRCVNEDLFLSLAAGSDILKGFLATPEHRSFTAQGLLWVNQAWLSHILLFLSFDRLGPAGPVLIKVVLLAACLAVGYVRCRALGASPACSLIALWAGAIAVWPFLGIRPENFGLLCFLLFSSLLSIEGKSGAVRWVGLVVILGLWANLHGSFMVGLVLLGAKASLVTARRFFLPLWGVHEDLSTRILLTWWGICAAALLVVIVSSPYKTANLLMPFTQVGTEAVTAYSRDWLPLVQFGAGSLGPGPVELGGIQVVPYLLLVASLLVATCVALLRVRREGAARLEWLRIEMQSDWIMEAVIATVLLVLAFRFRRLILFSSFSLVPVIALVMAVVSRASTSSIGSVQWWKVVAAAGLCAATTLAAYRVAVVPYVPGNPLRPARPVMRELMSFDSFSPSMVDFLRKNGISGRTLAGWEISGYIMLYTPELRLFMDCRDQSLYPVSVIRDYFTILGIVPPSGRDATALLDVYGVRAVVLTTNPIEFNAAVSLMQSRRWACIYADMDSFVLVRADAPEVRSLLATAQEAELWYPDAATEAQSRAFLTLFLTGRIPADVVQSLEKVVATAPWPNAYGLIASGLDDDRKCFKQETVAYLRAEADRLAKLAEGSVGVRGKLVLQSRERIYEILEANAARCGDPVGVLTFRELKDEAHSRSEALRRYYLGMLF